MGVSVVFCVLFCRNTGNPSAGVSSNRIENNVRRLLGNRNSITMWQKNVWTPENVVKSPFPDVKAPDMTLSEYIWKDMDKWADKTAVVCGMTNRSYTYRELHKCSHNFAANLRLQFQIKDGDVIGIIMYNAPEYPIAVIGAIRAGAIVTTVNPNYTANEVHKLLQLTKPKIIICTSEMIELVKETFNKSSLLVPVITVDNNFENGLTFDTKYFGDLINDNVDQSILNDVRIRQEDVVFLLFSSGTTGPPKGVELTHRNVVINLAQQDVDLVRHYNETTYHHQDSVLAVVPFFHSYGLSIVLLHTLVIGAKLVTLPRFLPSVFLNTLKEYNINIIYAVPSIVQFLVNHPSVRKEELISLETIACGAAPLSKSDIARIIEKFQPNLKFVHCFGMTELSPFATSTIPGSQDYTTVGFALPSTEMRVVDSNDRNLGPDEVGELLIRGPQVMKGYRDNPEATKNAMTDDGWLRTGDLVTINRHGAVTLVDRIKDIIKVKGYQVSPSELEGILKEHPDVLEAAVIGVPDERTGEVPKAFVVLKNGYNTTDAQIKEFVNKNVAEFKRIKYIEFLDVLPMNRTGKVLRRILKKM